MTFKTRGQSLIEVLIAVTIGVFIILIAAGLIAPALKTSADLNKVQVSTSLAKELLENVRVFTESNWHNIDTLIPGTHYYFSTTTPFTIAVGDESIAVATTTYTRYFSIENVSRAGDDISTSTLGVANDPSVKKVVINYGWAGAQGTSVLSGYLSRYPNKSFLQFDWSGGVDSSNATTTFTNKFSTSSNIFSSSTGVIKIQGL